MGVLRSNILGVLCLASEEMNHPVAHLHVHQPHLQLVGLVCIVVQDVDVVHLEDGNAAVPSQL